MRGADLGTAGLRAAWRVDTSQVAGQWPAHLGGWVLECHGDIAMCAWHFWTLSLVHLRPVEGLPPANFQYPGAQHELVCIAMDPDEGNPLDKVERGETVKHLVPIDFVLQFHGLDDATALRAAEKCVELVVAGILSPDRDYRRRWVQLLEEQGAKFSPRFEVNQVGHA